MTDLNSLIMFAKVVEANSFSEAARRLNVPISTVSRRIAELEGQLGVRLLERSTRSLRLTDIGSELLECAQRSAELDQAVADVVSNRRSSLAGVLRISAPPSISDSLLVPLISAFQTSYPNVRVQVFVTDRWVDHIVQGADLVFRFGALKDSTLIARKILTYRHQLVASPAYLEKHKPPKTPQDLLDHRLLAFLHGKPRNSWTFTHVNGRDKETLTFQPHLSMNDYTGLAHALLAGTGIGDLPPLVSPELVLEGKLVEVCQSGTFVLSISRWFT
jgi:DNA-binding transcriptional LysR family regulator